MKSKLLAAILAVFAASSATAFANDEHNHEAPKADVAKTEKAEAKKPVKKHSHMEEKTNVPMSEPASHGNKEMPEDRHDHMKEKH